MSSRRFLFDLFADLFDGPRRESESEISQREMDMAASVQVVTEEIANVEKLDRARGALVASVAEDSPSDDAGIKSGDIILEFNGALINEMKELPKIVAETEVGKMVKVKVWRNQREITNTIQH